LLATHLHDVPGWSSGLNLELERRNRIAIGRLIEFAVLDADGGSNHCLDNLGLKGSARSGIGDGLGGRRRQRKSKPCENTCQPTEPHRDLLDDKEDWVTARTGARWSWAIVARSAELTIGNANSYRKSDLLHAIFGCRTPSVENPMVVELPRCLSELIRRSELRL
jgi:hypothetical protein